MKIPDQWLHKTPIVVNKKLAEEIMNVLPFDFNYKQAKYLLKVIFDVIKDELILNGGPVTIERFGSFRTGFYKAHRHGLGWSKARWKATFKPCRRLQNSLIEREPIEISESAKRAQRDRLRLLDVRRAKARHNNRSRRGGLSAGATGQLHPDDRGETQLDGPGAKD
jgi:nucleoid DNA-binding protein